MHSNLSIMKDPQKKHPDYSTPYKKISLFVIDYKYLKRNHSPKGLHHILYFESTSKKTVWKIPGLLMSKDPTSITIDMHNPKSC